MIPYQWDVILDSKEVKKNQVIGVRRTGVNLVVWRNSKGEDGAAGDYPIVLCRKRRKELQRLAGHTI